MHVCIFYFLSLFLLLLLLLQLAEQNPVVSPSSEPIFAICLCLNFKVNKQSLPGLIKNLSILFSNALYFFQYFFFLLDQPNIQRKTQKHPLKKTEHYFGRLTLSFLFPCSNHSLSSFRNCSEQLSIKPININLSYEVLYMQKHESRGVKGYVAP